MDLEEIKTRLDETVQMFGAWPIEVHAGNRIIRLHRAYKDLCEIRRLLDEPCNEAIPDDGFVVLPIARFDELRQAEEDLQDVRVAASSTAGPLMTSHLGDIHGEVLRIKDRAEETDRRLRSFGARLAEVEARRAGAAS